jgi:hypothetical protein
MSRLIASILLSILLFPLAAVAYLVVFFVFAETRGFSRFREELGMLAAGVITWALLAWYWVVVWRKTVKWTPRRTARTLYAALAAAGVGLMAGIMTGSLQEEFGFFIGSITPPLLWVVATVLVWRETDAERSARLRAVGRDGPGIPCPTCSYDLTGLKSTRCPECGSEFTLDELLAAQPERAAVELER